MVHMTNQFQRQEGVKVGSFKGKIGEKRYNGGGQGV